MSADDPLLARALLMALRLAAASRLGELYLVTPAGDWVARVDDGAVIPEDARLAERYPRLWPAIAPTASGVFATGDGFLAQAPVVVPGAAGVQGWRILVVVSADVLAAERASVRWRVAWLVAGLSALVMAGGWFLAMRIAQRRQARRQVESLAHFDNLTGLPNRLLFFDRLERIHAHSARYRRRYALIYVNVDGFKDVNDRFGHVDADQLLVRISRMLINSLRRSDTVARIGGDEFAVLLSEVSDVEAALRLGEKTAAAIRAPIRLSQGEVEVGASVGVSVFPAHGDGPDELLRAANDAMCAAKRAGKARCMLARDMSGDDRV